MGISNFHTQSHTHCVIYFEKNLVKWACERQCYCHLVGQVLESHPHILCHLFVAPNEGPTTPISNLGCHPLSICCACTWCKVGLPLTSTFWMVVGLQTKAINSTSILTFSCKFVLYIAVSMLICLDYYTSHIRSAIMLHVMLLRRFCIMIQFLHSLIVSNYKTFKLLDISCNMIDKNMLELSPNSFYWNIFNVIQYIYIFFKSAMIKPVECQSNGIDFGGSSPYSGHYLSYKQLAKFCHLCLKWCNLLFFHCESKKVWIHFSSACHVANPTKYACPHCNWLSSYQRMSFHTWFWWAILKFIPC